MFGERVVDGNDRELQRAVLRHGVQTNDAGGGLFGAADHVLDLVGALGEKLGDQVRAVVHGDLRMVIERRVDVRVVRGVVFALDGVGGDAVVPDAWRRGRNLRGERI